MHEYLKREKAVLPGGKSPFSGQLKSMAGIPQKGFDSLDPVRHVQDTFFTGFAAHGRAMSRLQERGLPRERDELPAQAQRQGMLPAQQESEQEETLLPTGGMEERYQSSALSMSQGRFLHRFADTAFSRGDLAAGVMQGQGKMMLVSTMKQAITQSPPDNELEERLWSSTSTHKKLPLRDTRVVYNKDEVRSAVGLVVNSIASGRNALIDMRKAAQLCGSANSGGETLSRMYPFLSVEEDKKSLANIESQLREIRTGGDPEHKQMLEHGARKMHAIIEKKEAMRLRFIQLIDQISANAQRAEEEFAQNEFADQLFKELYAYAPEAYSGEELPPDEGGEDSDPNDNNKTP